MILLQQVSEEVNRSVTSYTTVQILTPTPTLKATMQSVTDGRTDRQTDDGIVTIAHHTARNTIGKKATNIYSSPDNSFTPF